MGHSGDERMLYLTRHEVEELCREIDSVEVMRAVFLAHNAGQVVLPAEAYLGWTNALGERARSLNMPGYFTASHLAGTKIINGNSANPQRGLPRASGLTLLFDDVSARVVCLMDSAAISSLRTASVTALAVDVLQRAPVLTLAVIGAGVLARAHIELLSARLASLREIALFDLDVERAELLRRQVEPRLVERGITLRVTASAEEAVRAAQVVVPATTTTRGYIASSWLQAGALLVNISLDDPLPEVILRAGKVIVDDWELVRDDQHRLLGRMYRQGTLLAPDDTRAVRAGQQRRVDAEFGEIISGRKPGRTTDDEYIVLNPFGLSLEDIAVAFQVYHAALERNIGRWLER
ncbi:MAG TPA: ornithine cyclodeaminase family protein [Ktedonobacteraceae bacterium]|nr:ornithine cyclodeaminase family protein [Ktedonobacteraceae bacterium]